MAKEKGYIGPLHSCRLLAGGGLDLADGTPASRVHLKSREYHHLFPDALLQNVGGLKGEQPYKALNCALIT